MFKGYKELSDKEKLILVQLPQGKLVGSPSERERVFVSLSELRKESGLSVDAFSKAVKKLLKKGLVEKSVQEFLQIFRNTSLPVKSAALCRAGKAVKKVRGRKVK